MVDENERNDRVRKGLKHFSDHVGAITSSAKNIAHISAALRKEGRVDRREDLHNQLDAEVAQLHLAVNNANAVPEEDMVENTGGAARTEAIDPNASKEEQPAA